MAQTYHKMLMHIVFSTKNRTPDITPDMANRLHAYMATIVSNKFGFLLRIGGVENHVHLLVDMKPAVAAAIMLRDLKAGSSAWVHETFPQKRFFAWQAGYGIFSVSESGKDSVIEYINRQAEHHQRMTYEQEVLALLTKYQVKYDEKYLWD